MQPIKFSDESKNVLQLAIYATKLGDFFSKKCHICHAELRHSGIQN